MTEPLVGTKDCLSREASGGSCLSAEDTKPRQKEYFDMPGRGGFIDKYGYPFCRGRIMGVVEKDEGQYDTVIPVFWATGAALFIRRTDYVNGRRIGWDSFLLTWKK